MQYQLNSNLPVIYQGLETSETVSTSAPFIGANTEPTSLAEINHRHIIPVFIKDNEPVISHGEFVGAAMNAVQEMYHGETINSPSVRVSHPIKGRIPEAKNKPANQLLDSEKTIYYERMAFAIEIPTINTDINGNRLNLTVGGVKSYSEDNLYNKSGADQHFKIFIGFKNLVCCNMCVSTDGLIGNLKVKNLDMLRNSIRMLLLDFNAVQVANSFKEFSQYELTEQQFAQLIGRCRMYRYLPESMQQEIPQLQFGESQLNTVCADYFRDKNFCRNDDGKISLWRLYNLFTGSNKSSYIDTFLDRSANAFELIKELKMSIAQGSSCWYLN